MIQTLTILGGDRRQTILAGLLASRGYQVAYRGVPGLPDTHESLADSIRFARILLLPMPALDKGLIRGTDIPLQAVLDAARPGTILLGGRLGCVPQKDGLSILDYAEDEALAVGNAVPTAEAAICLALQKLERTLRGSRVLVIGYGRIGRALALRLHLLGAEVTVATRSAAHRAECQGMGMVAEETGHYAAPLSGYDCIFNTVPCPVLNAAQLRSVRPDCPILDLASLPGGLSPACTPGENYRPALALPGKFFPITAAELLCETIIRCLKMEEEKA